MKERIKALRKSLNLTQQQFADRIGLKRNSVANYEIGRNEPMDTVIHSICREFGVSEEWLRTGDGEMFPAMDREKRITAELSRLMSPDDASAKKQLIDIWLQLDEEDCQSFLKFAEMLIASKKEKE